MKIPIKGFTLIEMLIAAAVLSIISVIAIPAYMNYLEKGYFSQAQLELLSISQSFQAELLKLPALSPEQTSDKLQQFVDAYPIHEKIKEKYRFAGKMQDGNMYRINAVPTQSNYTLSAWTDQLGNLYLCTNTSAAQAFRTKNGCKATANKSSQ